MFKNQIVKRLTAITCAVFLAGGCSKPDSETDEFAKPSDALGGKSVEQVGASTGTMAAKQNAQNIATVAASARAAGYAEPWAGKEAAVADLVAGVRVRLGSQEMSYSAGSLGAAAQQEAMEFLAFDPNPPGMLRFTETAQP